MPDEPALRSDPWNDRLSEYVDGELDAATRAAVEAHLAECAECRATVAMLERVVTRARALPYRAPVTDLWPPIAREAERVRPIASRRRMLTLSLTRLTAAAAIIATVAAGVAWEVASRRAHPTVVASESRESETRTRAAEVAPTPLPTTALALASYRDAAQDLERLLDASRSSLRPETMAVIEANLRTIDAAIAQADSALRRDPGSAYLNQYLAATMQRKLKLLRRAVEITTARS